MGGAPIIVQVMAYLIPIMVAAIMIFTLIMFFSPKARGKWMGKQYKSARYMMDEAKDDMEYVTKEGIKIAARGTKEGLDEAKDDIEYANTTMANASKEGIKTVAKAIKEGFTEDEGIHCKHCGEVIDNDSKFCKKCGKEQ